MNNKKSEIENILNYYSEYLIWTSNKKIIEKPISDDAETSDKSFTNNNLIKHISTNESNKIVNSQQSRNTSFFNVINENNISKIMKLNPEVIFPFGINGSQYKAVKNSINNNISVIQGPPGTGKTKTIVNIIANIILNNSTVGVISNNNSAVDNVAEKLNEAGMGMLYTRLGNKDICQTLISNFTEIKNRDYDKLINTLSNLTDKEVYKHYSNLEIERYYELIFELQKIKQLKRESKIEINNFKNLYANDLNEILFLKKIKSQKMVKLKKIIYRKKIASIHKEKKIIKKYKINKKLKNPILSLIRFFDMNLMNESLVKIDKRIISLESKIKNIYPTLEKDIVISGFNKFGKYLLKKYKDKNEINKFMNECIKVDDYGREYIAIKNLKKISPVILSTMASFPINMGISQVDYLIIDEASQALTMNSLICMMHAKNIIIVGDLKQLPQIDDQNFEEFIGEKYKNNKPTIKSHFDIKNNILSTIEKIYGNTVHVTLTEHYRCLPSIINFCNKKFYNNELLIMTNEDKIDHNPVEIILDDGNYYTKQINSRPQSERESELLSIAFNNSEFQNDVGYITPYSGQAKFVTANNIKNKLMADTVHKYQGRENEHIVFGVTNDKITKFNDSNSLINVAVSRAKKKFTLIVSKQALESKKESNILDLYKYIKYINPNIIEPKLSIFDSLKDGKTVKELSYLKENYKFDSDAELICFKLINEILAESYPSLEMRQHVRLFRIIGNIDDFSYEEKKFLTHPWAHVDFLLINKFDKSPVCVIEVDGVSFHNKPEVKRRDDIKDRALTKNNIPVVRWRTDQFNEKEKLLKVLKDIAIN